MGVPFPQRLSQRQRSARHLSTFFLITLLSAVFFRRFVLDQNDPYKCRALAQEGQWYNDDTWLTPGCQAETYGVNSLRECMPNKTITLIGDESIQSIYWALRQKLNPDLPREFSENDLFHKSKDMKLEYLWDPHLNRSELSEYVRAFQGNQISKPAILVVGAPRLLAERGALDQYRERLDSLASDVRPATSLANAGFNAFDAEDGPGDLLLFAPLQEPLAEDGVHAASAYAEINDYLRVQARIKGLDVLWGFDRMTADREDKYMDDNIKPRPGVARQRAELLISLRCTAKFSQQRKFANTRSCCGTWKHRNWIQTAFLASSLAVLPATVAFDFVRPVLSEQSRAAVRAFSAFSAAIALQYIADRTHIFEQVPKLPELEPFNFGIMVLVAFLAGVITIRRSTPLKQLAPGEKQSLPFLPRDQTEEIKGWMQLCIIIYHWNKAWTSQWIWEGIRTIVATYLFLTGFGHTVYFLRKGDYSFRRVVSVMLRTNLLPVTLAYVMHTRWLLYYYMPLSSFWFLVVYATLGVGAKYNTYRLFVVAKTLVSAFAVHTFVTTRDLPETVVRLATLVFKMDFDADAFFHQRVKMDRYIVYVGMLVAMFYLWALEALAADGPQGSVKRYFRTYFSPLRITVAGLSAVVFGYFSYLAGTQFDTHDSWKKRQPYITAIPIISFLVLRNVNSSARNYFSFAFAWLGRYSGELYVMQDHLWLAGDQKAVLRTGLFHGDETLLRDRWRDLLLITPLYLIACCVIGDSTAVITSWFTKDSAPWSAATSDRGMSADEAETGLLSEKDGDGEYSAVASKQSKWSNLLVEVAHVLWPRKLRSRALLLVGVLWLLNLTYT